jgi:hypothetical protein
MKQDLSVGLTHCFLNDDVEENVDGELKALFNP